MPDITSVNMCGIQFYSYRPDITLFVQAVVSACRILGFTFRKKWNISRCMKSLKFRYRQGVRKHVIGLTEVQMAVSLCWQKHIWNLKKTRQSMQEMLRNLSLICFTSVFINLCHTRVYVNNIVHSMMLTLYWYTDGLQGDPNGDTRGAAPPML